MLCIHQDAWLNDGNQIFIIMSESNSLFTQDVLVKPCYISYARLKRVTFYTTDRDHWSTRVKHSSNNVERCLGMRMYILHPEVFGKERSCWCSTFSSLPREPNTVTFAWHTWIRSSSVKLGWWVRLANTNGKLELVLVKLSDHAHRCIAVLKILCRCIRIFPSTG